MTWFPGRHLRRSFPLAFARLAAVTTALLLVGVPVLAGPSDILATADPDDAPDTPGEDPEDVPDTHLTSHPTPVCPANPLPGDHPSFTSHPLPPNSALATRTTPAGPFGPGLCVRLRC
jgi:hypothetical protein